MKIQSKLNSIITSKSEAIIVGLNEDLKISGILKDLDTASKGFFESHSKSNNLPQKPNQIRTFHNVNGITAESVIIVAYKSTKIGLINASKSISSHLRQHKISDADITLHLESFRNNDKAVSLDEKTNLSSRAILDADYICEDYKSKKTERDSININYISENKNDTKSIEDGIRKGVAVATGMNALKDLGNAPGNICTPKYLAKKAKKLAQEFDSLDVNILKEQDIKELKMGALLSVSKGSIEKPRLIVLKHNGGGDENPIVLVGKGVTFDTGGISLKPGAGMDEMKYDMCGAGSVLGTMRAIAMLELPINVIGVIPAVENMPSDRATKPGDIVTSMSGKTIEVLNTDAEGRMILCDALTYSERFNPKAIIDIATLTGAIIIALGNNPCGLMSNSDELSKDILDAGQQSGDRAWRLPIWEEYVEQIQSPFADLQNIGGREAGSITAGCFLGEFTKNMNWAHLDIAGTAWKSGKNKGATGRPVPLLVEYVLSQV